MSGPPPPTQGFDPLPTQRVPLCTILRYPYLVTNRKIFLKAPLAPIYTNFEGGARAKKQRVFLVKILQKVPKNAFFGLFFNLLPYSQILFFHQYRLIFRHEQFVVVNNKKDLIDFILNGVIQRLY